MSTDISGFTAWSSVREPSQVFELLESIYANFDTLAEQKGVYKVETVSRRIVLAQCLCMHTCLTPIRLCFRRSVTAMLLL